MSINGSQVLSDIQRAKNNARQQAQADESTLSQLRNQHASATRKLQEAYETLVRVRAGEAQVNRRGLADVDAWLLEAAAKRDKSYQNLLVKTTEKEAMVARFKEALLDHEKQRDATQLAWDQARESMRVSLAGSDPDFIAATQRAADAVRRSQAIDVHLAEITAATKDFEKNCESDPFFVYCHSRNVGTDHSAGNFITKGLDRLVAKATGYYDNRQLLLNAKQDLRQWVKHQALLHEELNQARQEVEVALDRALENETAQGMMRSAQEASERALATKKGLRQTQEELTLLNSQKKEFDNEQDPQSREMRDKLFDAISKASDLTLKKAAGETPTKEDDASAQVVAALRQEIPAISLEITRASEKAKASAEQHQRLEKLVSSFSSRGYDGRYSRFDYGFDANALITGVILGQMSVSQAMNKCDTLHRDVTPPPPPPPPPSYSNDSNSGGFGSGGGFGGGSSGFSTGGGF